MGGLLGTAEARLEHNKGLKLGLTRDHGLLTHDDDEEDAGQDPRGQKCLLKLQNHLIRWKDLKQCEEDKLGKQGKTLVLPWALKGSPGTTHSKSKFPKFPETANYFAFSATKNRMRTRKLSSVLFE